MCEENEWDQIVDVDEVKRLPVGMLYALSWLLLVEN